MGLDKKGVTAVEGFRAAGLHCGIKKNGLADLALLVADRPSTAAAVFTRNRFPAPPLQVTRRHLRGGVAQAVVVNSGNANAFTGEIGLRDAEAMASTAAEKLGIPTRRVLVASTGVIGVRLPMDKITKAIPVLTSRLSFDRGHEAAEAIRTTDMFTKEVAVSGRVERAEVTIGGMAKGSGMIHPNMATMLAFLTTDVQIPPPLLQQGLRKVVDGTFNAITVDGETSTNDMVLCLANGRSVAKIGAAGTAFRQFVALLTNACEALAKMVVKDGEGATKRIEIVVTGAKDNRSARRVAMTVAKSPLVKTAFFGEDANWGRIVAAIGNAGTPIDPNKIDLTFGDVALVRRGRSLGAAAETAASLYLREKDLQLTIGLSAGRGRATVWTCDLSGDYVRINAAYRT